MDDKKLELVSSQANPNLYLVVWRGGSGKVPNVLKGLWSKRTGLAAIEQYNRNK